jgi:hypothetical protein
MTLHPDLYPSNDTIRDILATYDDYYTALHSALCNPERPSKLYTKIKVTPNIHDAVDQRSKARS